MASFGELMTRTAQAAADLTATQYHLLRHTGAGLTNISSQAEAASPASMIGVQQNKPNTNEAVTIAYFGETKIVAGGALTVNRWITTNGSGRAAAAVSGDNVIGMVLETAGGDGDVVRALISPSWRLTGASS